MGSAVSIVTEYRRSQLPPIAPIAPPSPAGTRLEDFDPPFAVAVPLEKITIDEARKMGEKRFAEAAAAKDAARIARADAEAAAITRLDAVFDAIIDRAVNEYKAKLASGDFDAHSTRSHAIQVPYAREIWPDFWRNNENGKFGALITRTTRRAETYNMSCKYDWFANDKLVRVTIREL